MTTRLSSPPISPARHALLTAQGWRAIGRDSMVSPEFEIVDGERTGRQSGRQFAIAYDETDQRRGVFATSDGDARGPGMFPRLEKFK